MSFVLKTLLSLSLFSTLVSAIELDKLIQISLQNASSLKLIDAKIKSAQGSVAFSDAYKNPMISLDKNSLSSKEAMSTTSLSLSQTLPYFNKNKERKNLAISKKTILDKKLINARSKLILALKLEAYTIWEIKEKEKIIDEFTNLTKHRIKLFESASLSANKHMGIMKAQLSLSELLIQKTTLRSQIVTSLAKLSYLSGIDVTNVELNLFVDEEIAPIQTLPSFKTNTALKVEDAKISMQEAKSSLISLEKYPDFLLKAKYSYRENFNDFLTLGLSLKIPLYGTERKKEELASLKVLEQQSSYRDRGEQLSAEHKKIYAQMLLAYNIYHILRDDALSKLEHILELSDSSVSTGSDLFKYIDVLYTRLSLEKKRIQAIASYNKAKTKIQEIRGELL